MCVRNSDRIAVCVFDTFASEINEHTKSQVTPIKASLVKIEVYYYFIINSVIVYFSVTDGPYL